MSVAGKNRLGGKFFRVNRKNLPWRNGRDWCRVGRRQVRLIEHSIVFRAR